ncbi:hypothetical protein ACJD0Z_09655 [Flavobacteriaceae bacterium M23B6Z8]
MKKNKRIFDLNKKTVSNLNKNAEAVKGGRASIIKPTTDPTAMTWCYICPEEPVSIF